MRATRNTHAAVKPCSSIPVRSHAAGLTQRCCGAITLSIQCNKPAQRNSVVPNFSAQHYRKDGLKAFRDHFLYVFHNSTGHATVQAHHRRSGRGLQSQHAHVLQALGTGTCAAARAMVCAGGVTGIGPEMGLTRLARGIARGCVFAARASNDSYCTDLLIRNDSKTVCRSLRPAI